MATIEGTKKPTVRNFIGRAWVNSLKTGKLAGQSMIRISLDRGIKVGLDAGVDQLELWPNEKREGKKDADFRVSVVSPKV